MAVWRDPPPIAGIDDSVRTVATAACLSYPWPHHTIGRLVGQCINHVRFRSDLRRVLADSTRMIRTRLRTSDGRFLRRRLEGPDIQVQDTHGQGRRSEMGRIYIEETHL
jgi:hypothetical protein